MVISEGLHKAVRLASGDYFWAHASVQSVQIYRSQKVRRVENTLMPSWHPTTVM